MRRDRLLLDEIVDAAEQARTLVRDATIEDLRTDRQRRDALLWNFTVLGEATNAVSDELKRRFPEVPWRQPVSLRNRIVHGYWSVDIDVLYTTAIRSLEDFSKSVREIRDLLDSE